MHVTVRLSHRVYSALSRHDSIYSRCACLTTAMHCRVLQVRPIFVNYTRLCLHSSLFTAAVELEQ